MIANILAAGNVAVIAFGIVGGMARRSSLAVVTNDGRRHGFRRSNAGNRFWDRLHRRVIDDRIVAGAWPMHGRSMVVMVMMVVVVAGMVMVMMMFNVVAEVVVAVVLAAAAVIVAVMTMGEDRAPAGGQQGERTTGDETETCLSN
jgi:hypothetical protein